MSRKGWYLFFLSGFVWGIPYLLIRVAVEEVDATVVVFVRVLIGALIFIPITWQSCDEILEMDPFLHNW
ncbi:MAG: hypothetical protein RL129_1400 [Actinomycetota bacterium]